MPAAYLEKCATWSPYNPHTPFSLQWEHNADGHVAGAPKDAYWKSGAGGFCLYVIPSLDLVIYKLGGKTGQYEPTLTRIPQPTPDTSRDSWEPIQGNAFMEGPASLGRILEMVCAAVRLD